MKKLKLFSKKDIEANVITDGGVVQKRDLFSLHVIVASNLVSLLLIILGILVMIHA